MICENDNCEREAIVICWVCGKNICSRHEFVGSCRLDHEIDVHGEVWIVPQPLHQEADDKYRKKKR